MSRKLGTPGCVVARSELKAPRPPTDAQLLAQARRDAKRARRALERSRRLEGQPRSYH